MMNLRESLAQSASCRLVTVVVRLFGRLAILEMAYLIRSFELDQHVVPMPNRLIFLNLDARPLVKNATQPRTKLAKLTEIGNTWLNCQTRRGLRAARRGQRPHLHHRLQGTEPCRPCRLDRQEPRAELDRALLVAALVRT